MATPLVVQAIFFFSPVASISLLVLGGGGVRLPALCRLLTYRLRAWPCSELQKGTCTVSTQLGCLRRWQQNTCSSRSQSTTTGGGARYHIEILSNGLLVAIHTYVHTYLSSGRRDRQCRQYVPGTTHLRPVVMHVVDAVSDPPPLEPILLFFYFPPHPSLPRLYTPVAFCAIPERGLSSRPQKRQQQNLEGYILLPLYPRAPSCTTTHA